MLNKAPIVFTKDRTMHIRPLFGLELNRGHSASHMIIVSLDIYVSICFYTKRAQKPPNNVSYFTVHEEYVLLYTHFTPVFPPTKLQMEGAVWVNVIRTQMCLGVE